MVEKNLLVHYYMVFLFQGQARLHLNDMSRILLETLIIEVLHRSATGVHLTPTTEISTTEVHRRTITEDHQVQDHHQSTVLLPVKNQKSVAFGSAIYLGEPMNTKSCHLFPITQL